jgi:hypothetical protein
MPHSLGKIRQRIFRIPTDETTFARRGFHDGNRSAASHLEQVGRSFVYGYDAALGDDNLQTLTQHLDCVEAEWRGFAFEGAAMALTLMDHLFPSRDGRLRAFLAGPAAAHTYMVHVGAGWGVARLPWLRRSIDRYLDHFDCLLRWLTIDGYGFHEGYFHWPQSVVERRIPKRLVGYACRAFDQGLGRSLWFVEGTDADRIAITIGKFAPLRQSDLWSGIGLACAYAGGADFTSVEALRKSAGPYAPELAQGAAFAAKARQRAGIHAEHTNLACRVFCRLSAEEASAVTDRALKDLPPDADPPAYEVWRERIRTTITSRNFP